MGFVLNDLHRGIRPDETVGMGVASPPFLINPLFPTKKNLQQACSS